MASSVATAAQKAAASGSSGMMKWAVGGWLFFIAENAVLSENRNYLIDALGGDEIYHAVYGTCSTAAMASIGYGYRQLQRATAGPPAAAAQPAAVFLVSNPALRLGLAFATMSLGLVLASQTAPKLQVPVALTSATTAAGGAKEDEATYTANPKLQKAVSTETTTPAPSNAKGGWNLQVRCPFDFTDNKNHGDNATTAVHGLDRVTRHPGLWAFGLISASQSFLAPTLPLTVWWLGPAAVALLGGAHSDSRFRRGLGGSWDPDFASQTSNVPFAALLSGRQGNQAFQTWVTQEVKPLNAALAVMCAGVWVASRGRGAAGRTAAGKVMTSAVQPK